MTTAFAGGLLQMTEIDPIIQTGRNGRLPTCGAACRKNGIGATKPARNACQRFAGQAYTGRALAARAETWPRG